MTDETETQNTALNIYVAGANTFVGLAAVRHLAKAGHHVVGQTVGSAGATAVRAAGGIPVYDDPYRAGEIVSSLRMAQAAVVVNCSPQAANQVPFHKIDWDVRRLSEGTSALIQAAKTAEVDFFIHLSYAFLYGDYAGESVDESAESQFPDEIEDLFAPALQAEKQVLDGGISACILRAGYVYGAESEALIALQNTIGRGIPLGSASAVSNWIYVDDLAQAVELAAVKHAEGLFNVVDDDPVAPRAFADRFAQALGLRVANPGGPFLNRTTRLQAYLLKNAVRAKNDKAKNKLGWQPKYRSQREGIDQAFLYWRAAQSTT